MAQEPTEKQKIVIERMKKIRHEDYINLRKLISERLLWCQTEKQKGIEEIKKLELQLARLDGAIAILNELLKNK